MTINSVTEPATGPAASRSATPPTYSQTYCCYYYQTSFASEIAEISHLRLSGPGRGTIPVTGNECFGTSELDDHPRCPLFCSSARLPLHSPPVLESRKVDISWPAWPTTTPTPRHMFLLPKPGNLPSTATSTVFWMTIFSTPPNPSPCPPPPMNNDASRSPNPATCILQDQVDWWPSLLMAKPHQQPVQRITSTLMHSNLIIKTSLIRRPSVQLRGTRTTRLALSPQPQRMINSPLHTN